MIKELLVCIFLLVSFFLLFGMIIDSGTNECKKYCNDNNLTFYSYQPGAWVVPSKCLCRNEMGEII